MNNSKIIIVALTALIIGLAGGYYYGNFQGIEKGRADLLAEQKAEQEEALKRVQDAANPFSETGVNPFKDVYKNPFAE